MFAQHGSKQTEILERPGDRLSTLPILVLNAHSRCNCRCVMCDIWKREQSTEITASDLDRHRDSLRRLQVERVVLTGGEPLMHRDLVSLCTFFRELGVRLTLLTTGLLLARRADEVATGFDDVILSLDGPQAVHDSVRRVKGSFHLIAAGVSALRERRPQMRITARTTVQRLNHRHLRETVRASKALRLDGISFLAADVTSEAFNRPLTWPAERQGEVALSVDDLKDLQDEMEALIREFDGEITAGYIAESRGKLRRIVHHFRVLLGLATPQSPLCNAPWVSAVIEANGIVRPCFFHRPIGDLRHDALEDIVNGKAACAFRRELDVASDRMCKNCVCSLYRP